MIEPKMKGPRRPAVEAGHRLESRRRRENRLQPREKTALGNGRTGDGHTPIGVSDRQLSKFFKALSDETRRSILILLESEPHSVGDIVDNFHLSQPTISRHLSVLREADLVIDQRRGQHVIYRINGQALTSSFLGFFGEFRRPRKELEKLRGTPSRIVHG